MARCAVSFLNYYPEILEIVASLPQIAFQLSFILLHNYLQYHIVFSVFVTSINGSILEVIQEMTKKWGCTTAGEAQQIPHAALVACFGDRLGTYAWKAVQGLKAEQGQDALLIPR